jgi:hypothetical protein
MRNRRFVWKITPLLACATAFAVVAIPGLVLADTPPGWDSMSEAQPHRVALRVTGFVTLVFLVLLFLALRVARAIRTHKRRARSPD